MMRNWKKFGLPTMLAAALAAAPTVTASDVDDQGSDKKPNDVLRELRDDVKKLQKDFQDFQESQKLNTQLQAEDVRRLKDEIAQLRKQLDELKTRTASTSVSGYAPAQTETARVRMINTYPEQMTIVVNGRAYRVDPFQTVLSEPIAAGTFTYEVLGVTRQRTRTVGPNQIFTFTVHPQG